MKLLGRIARPLRLWIDSGGPACEDRAADGERLDWPRLLPFALLHLGCLGVLWVGVSGTALLVAGGLYLLRMFAITAFYHRYFSHRSYSTSRAAQFCFAVLGASAAQRGPLWWAAHHRIHHRHSDEEGDSHSPLLRGFWWSHMLWFMNRNNFRTPWKQVTDLARYPELVFLERFALLVPVVLAAALFGLGQFLAVRAPELGTSGPQLLVWGFCVSTVVLYHGTFTINSLAHRFGTRRYATADSSRNNLLLALLTLGEGWHNNHHYYPGTARQGFRRREIDPTWYALRLLARLGVIWNLRDVPASVVEAGGRP